jgi:saccharolysin
MDNQNKVSPNALRFDHSAEEIVSLAESSIAEWTAQLDAIISSEAERTFQNTIEPIAKFEYNTGKIGNNLQFYKHMSTSKELRDASLTASKKFDDFGIELWMRYDFFLAIQKFRETSVASGEWDSLDAESQRYVDRILRDFERNGMQLPEE